MDSVTERYGVDPGAAFGIGDSEQPAVTYGSREYAFDGGGGDSGSGSGSGNDSGSAAEDDGYERDAGGGYKFNRDGTRRRKRGRKPGSSGGSHKSESKNVLKTGGIEKILLSMHGMAAAFSNTPELALDPDEGKKLAEGFAEVAQFYDFGMTPEQAAWANFAMIAVPIYGSRIFVIWQRLKLERANNARPTQPAKTKAPVATPGPAPVGPIMTQGAGGSDPFGAFKIDG